jgi:ADP-ribosylglycohydrolase
MSKMLSSVLLCCFMSGMAMATAQPSTHVQKNVVPGGDSDTIAAIAGGIAEAMHGIPTPSANLLGHIYQRTCRSW